MALDDDGGGSIDISELSDFVQFGTASFFAVGAGDGLPPDFDYSATPSYFQRPDQNGDISAGAVPGSDTGAETGAEAEAGVGIQAGVEAGAATTTEAEARMETAEGRVGTSRDLADKVDLLIRKIVGRLGMLHKGVLRASQFGKAEKTGRNSMYERHRAIKIVEEGPGGVVYLTREQVKKPPYWV